MASVKAKTFAIDRAIFIDLHATWPLSLVAGSSAVAANLASVSTNELVVIAHKSQKQVAA